MNLSKTLKVPLLSGFGMRPQTKVIVVSLVLSFVLKTDFRVFLTRLVCLKSVK
jgi:hypothetical protein